MLTGQDRQLVPQHDEFQVLGELGLPTPNEQPQNSREHQVSEGEQHRPILPRPRTVGLTTSIAAAVRVRAAPVFLIFARAREPIRRNAVESGERRQNP
jgi:CTP:molybdopterin cytidylyltransferase MocA